MTKLVAGYVPGRVTSPHQFVFVFIFVNNHPYESSSCLLLWLCVSVPALLLCSCRFEDVTPPESVRLNPKADRSLLLYGYLRGAPLKPHTRIHLAGVGDFDLQVICVGGGAALL